jgi:putative CRISPR-associated protein (TIGR02619 family)
LLEVTSMHKIITTVGASIYDNFFYYDNSLRSQYENLQIMEHRQWDNVKDRVHILKNSLIEWVKGKNDASAEIESLLNIQKELNDDLEVYLISSDTVISRLAAEVIQDGFSKQNSSNDIINNIKVLFEPDKDIIQGLQIKNRKIFEEEGLYNLISRIEQIIACDTYVDWKNTALNITGGYKATVPYLTILGQVHQIPMYYIFENTGELIKIPQAPLSINLEMFEKYYDIFKQLDNGIEGNWTDFKRKNNIQDDFQACIWSDKEMTGLSAIGKLFWRSYMNFFTVEVPRGSYFFSDKKGNQKELKIAFQELYSRLHEEITNNDLKNTREILQHLKKLNSNNDLHHGETIGKDKFIFKSTKSSQVRLLYQPEIIGQHELKIYIYEYLRGNFKGHEGGEYIRSWKNRWKAQLDPEFTKLTFLKGEAS